MSSAGAPNAASRGATTDRPARRGARWAGAGLLLGVAAMGASRWPADALADWVDQATAGRVALSDARGTLWEGSAVLEIRGGRDSRSARALPGRLHWSMTTAGDGPGRPLPALLIRHETASPEGVLLQAQRSQGAWTVQVRSPTQPDRAALALPASLLQGLGTPWNTLALDGRLMLHAEGLSVSRQPGRWSVQGRLTASLDQAASRLSPLRPLGSYTLDLTGGPTLHWRLSSQDGSALLLTGQGEWSAGQPLRVRGEAHAAPGREAVLNNLLNIIGRRDGARSLIAIG